MQEKEENIKLLKLKYELKIRNVREEARRNIFGHLFDRIRMLLSKVCHLFKKSEFFLNLL